MSDLKVSPPKRHPTLQPLSRDHYVGLLQGRQLMKSAGGDRARRREALAAFFEVWDAQIAAHFDDEERMLGPLASEASRVRLHKEHDYLRRLVNDARKLDEQTDPGEAWLRELGQAHVNHIHWEEREFFPELQATAANELATLEPEARQIEASRLRGRCWLLKTMLFPP